MLAEIAPIILTYNEEANIGRTLDALQWASEVLVLDSGSSDATIRIAGAYPNVRVCARPFDHHAEQWNHALVECDVRQEWVLALDADYVLPPELVAELAALRPTDDVSGYEIGFRYLIDGVALGASLYPPLVVLFRRPRARYVRHGHRMVLRLDAGHVVRLRHAIAHDDRKPYERWLASQRRYAVLEAERLRSLTVKSMRKRDWVRRAVVLAPWLVPLYCLVVLGLWRHGRAGWRYIHERTVAELLIARELIRGGL